MESSSSIAFVFLTIAIMSALNLFSGHAEVLCKENERQALLRFKQDLKDPMNHLSTWDSEADCCSWTGVVCHNITGHVLELHLGFPHNTDWDEFQFNSTYRLGGKINPSLLGLKYLNYLDLSSNNFEGVQIPSFIGSLTSLTYLNLSNAGFGGIIPHQLGNLSNLRYLNLKDEYGYGVSPHLKVESFQFIGGLSSLQYLDMGGVSLSNASDWLQVLNTLPSLVELHLPSCDIGNIPADHVPAVINFTSLTVLDLSFNNLGPSMPAWIFSLNNLDSLYLAGVASLKGTSIPFGLVNMTSRLKNLDLSNNYFSSTIPQWMCGFNRLESLELYLNSLVGKIPGAIGNLTSIRELDLSGNILEGGIPNSLGNLCRLNKLVLSGNKFSGGLSEIFERLSRCNMHSTEGERRNLVSLYIGYNLLSGPIPTSIGNLSSLQSLDVSDNQLNGSLPESFGQLVNLEYLDISHSSFKGVISNNLLSGPIPTSIGNLSSLQFLDVSGNQLNGSLPESFGQLVNLEWLDISRNSFKGVVSEVHFANLTRLKSLRAAGNSLTLKTSPNWLPPFQLVYLSLSSWYLGSEIPEWIRWQQHLWELQISNTGISGTIPTWFCDISSRLHYLNLSHNHFLGEFPCTIHSLSFIDLSSNLFNGSLSLPSSNIKVLDYSNNSFSGSVFHFFCNENKSLLNGPLPSSYIYLGNNLLSGEIPDCWWRWKNLAILSLRNNNLEGVIPSSMGYLTNLFSLQLSNNNISGELPMSLSKCTTLDNLDISENKFVGTIPKWIGTSFSTLKILNLRSNKFQSDIPPELCNLKDLQILDLAHNNISGTIPRCLYNLTAMTTLQAPDENSIEYFSNGGSVLREDAKVVIKGRQVSYSSTLNLVRIVDLSDNNIHGDITVELTRLLNLQALNLSNNHLTGKIPSEIGDMKALESLDLSRNQLHGEISTSISRLTFLSDLDLSYNNFTGPIPTSTQLQSFNESSFIGNQLCGPPLHQNCSVTGSTHSEGKQGGQGQSILEENYLYLSLALGFVFGFWGLLGSLFYNTRWRIAYCGFLDRIVLKLYAVIFEKF